jgi:hypothetical protein
MAYRDGVPMAAMEGDVVRELTPLDPAIAPDVWRALRHRRAAARQPWVPASAGRSSA